MHSRSTNWRQSVTGMLIKDKKVLLARHTYGLGNNMLLSPGGYVNFGESPQDALKREFMEETKIEIEPLDIIGIRFNMHDWYIAFRAEYISGTPLSDHNENSEVLWVDTNEALSKNDVPVITKSLIESALLEKSGLISCKEYEEDMKYAPYSLYRI